MLARRRCSCHAGLVAADEPVLETADRPAVLLRRGRVLEGITLGRVTLVDGILAVAVLAGLALNATAGLWWADPTAALVIVFYALREAREIFLGGQ
jgi:hypothetical protein